MNARKVIRTVSYAALLSAISVCGQGTFVNLNFEAANVPDIPAGQGGGNVAVTNGLPGWMVYLGNSPSDTMTHNEISLGAATVSIFGPNFGPALILAGRYTASLQPSSGGPSTSTAIGQTGVLPADAQSLRFYGTGSYVVTIGGQQIPLSVVGTTPRYTIYGGDVSAFASQTAELRIEGFGLLDNFVFSNQAIPEPSMLSITVLGAVAIFARYRRRK